MVVYEKNMYFFFLLVVFIKLRRELNFVSKILVNSVLHNLPNFWAQTQECELVYEF